MVLFLAATENIPPIDARRKIQQGTLTPAKLKYDFRNFPFLNTKKPHQQYCSV